MTNFGQDATQINTRKTVFQLHNKKEMKKIIPVLFFFLALFGCREEQKENQPKQEIHSGFVNFAAILVLDDLIENGIRSDFISLSPIPIVNPDDTMTADAVLEDFKRDFVASQDKYPLKLSEGLSITWNIDHNADAQYGLSFHKEDRTNKTIFAGKLSLRFDPEYYSSTSYPTYSKDSTTTIICREFTGATERKNHYLIWIDIAFDRCMALTDYYASVRNQLKSQLSPLKERLSNVYVGKEAVNETIAHKLHTFYQAGNTFADDSICLTGTREACLASLKNEIIKKYEDVPVTDHDHIRIRITDQTHEKKEAIHQSTHTEDSIHPEKPADNHPVMIKEKNLSFATEKNDASVVQSLPEKSPAEQTSQQTQTAQPVKRTQPLP